jgi:polyisoprenoid-binding protein YceI
MRTFLNRRRFLLLACSLQLAAGGLVRAAINSPSESAVLVSVRGPAGLDVQGVTHELGVAERDGDLVFQVPLTGLDTGIGLRNRHMRGYLDVAHFPEAELHVPRKKVVFPSQGRAVESVAQGTLTLHGIPKPCLIRYRAEQVRPDEYRIHGSTRIDIRNFGIAVPTWGVGVDPNVGIQVDFSVRGS